MAMGRPFHDALTRGGEIAVISGSNFGPATEAPISANYSVDGIIYTATDCTLNLTQQSTAKLPQELASACTGELASAA